MKPFVAAEILLPAQGTDMTVWPALACDQFTSQPEYWQKAEALCAGKPSTLHITLPEVYLEQPGVEARIEAIHATMDDYAAHVLTRRVNGFVYTERTTASGTRCGLVGAVDLEQYSYERGAQPAIRPTEGTIVSRIPPRLAVRRGGALETPHILMLLDDKQCAVLEPLAGEKAGMEKLYDTELMLGGGRAAGWAVTDPARVAALEDAVAAFGTQSAFDAHYPYAAGRTPLAIAVGDGNHSLATAKAHWEEIKRTLTPEQRRVHPARLCLVELVNLHSPALGVEPIHRAVFGTDLETFYSELRAFAERGAAHAPGAPQTLRLTDGQSAGLTVEVREPPHPLAVGTLELFLAEFTAAHPGVRVDYIHGEQAVEEVARRGAVGVLLPDFQKSDLFRGVVLSGVLPKKTFSMGHAQEKRYYLECRRIAL